MADLKTNPKVAFLGLGIMGAPMAANLARAGFAVVAWNRTPSKAQALANEHEDVTAAESAAQAAVGADFAISMVPDVPEVEAVLLGPDGAADGLAAGALAIDMSTIAPTASREIGERLTARGLGFLDAPVTGSRPRAEDGTLTIMVGGERADFERARPLFDAMGSLVVHAGPQGHGSAIKLINNTLAATNAAALAEGIAYAQAAGLDEDRLLEVLASGSGNSTVLELKARPMMQRDYEPLFKLEHMLKDVRYLLAEARAAGVEPSVAASAERLYADREQNGQGALDFAAVRDGVQKSGS